ncbi:F-box/FBD/LRR-repeat protein-like protein [Tanacetum coccineum]
MFLDSFQEVDQWMLFLSRNGVQEFHLMNTNQRYELPSYVFSCLELRTLKLDNCFFKPPLKFDGFFKLEDLDLKHINFVALLIAEKIPKWLPHPVNTLKSLTFITLNFGDLDQLQGALCLLRNSPNLKKLCINNVQREPQLKDSDAGPVLNYLESPDCLDQTLNLLKTVEIKNIEGSRPELLFIKLLLAHSPSLKKFTIKPWGTSLCNKSFNIAKDVMQFPRASQKAKMIFLDLQP